MRTLAPRLLLLLLLALDVSGTRAADAAAERSEAERRGDAAWSERAAAGTLNAPAALRAVEAYEAALAADPQNLALRLKTIEALYFAGHFVADEAREIGRLTERQLERSEEGLAQIAAAAGGIEALERLAPQEQAKRLSNVAYARDLLLWSGISWGVWGQSHSRLAAMHRGAATKIRIRAETLIALDPSFASAGGLRLLGRMHSVAPHVPLFTGWIDRDEGLSLLRRANAISTADPRNPLFLAEAILDQEPEHRAEALALLRALVARKPDPGHLIEETEILDQARASLARAERGDD